MHRVSMSSSNPPCAACKLLRRKCTPGCIFAPYFPAEQPTKFANVHRVFGASNVAKLLKQLAPALRDEAAKSLSYEADAWTRDPVHGCVGFISILQHRLLELQRDLFLAKRELSAYISPGELGPDFAPYHQFNPAMSALGGPAAMGTGLEIVNSHPGQVLMRRDQQMAETLMVAREQMSMSVQQQQGMARMNLPVGFVETGEGYGLLGVAPVAVGDYPPQMPGLDGSFPLQQQQQQLRHVQHHYR